VKHYLRIGIGIAISALFLYLAFRGVDTGEVWEHMRHAKLGWLLSVGALGLYANWVRAQRWRYLYSHVKPIGVGSLFSSTSIGFLANAVLPFRMGEAAKAYSVSRKERVPLPTCLTTVIIERVFDMFCVLGMLALTIAIVPIPETATAQVEAARNLFGGVAVAALVAIGALLAASERVLRWSAVLFSPLPERVSSGLLRLLASVVDGVRALSDPRQLLRTAALSIWLWVILAISFALGLLGLGLEERVAPFEASVALTAMVAIFVMIPSAPGFVGTYQAGCIVALGIFGIEKSHALSFSLLVHAFTFAPAIVVGFVCLLREGLALGDVSSDATAPVG